MICVDAVDQYCFSCGIGQPQRKDPLIVSRPVLGASLLLTGEGDDDDLTVPRSLDLLGLISVNEEPPSVGGERGVYLL
jgi:hypothetical protein